MASEKGGPHDATVRHPFDDVETWVGVFDDPARDEWQKPGEVTRALGLAEGMVVADLGAGTGYFLPHLARAVGPTGWVLAVDTEPNLVRYLGQRARKSHVNNVIPVLADAADPFIPEGRADLVFLVDTYHHIDDRLDYFSRLKSALAPGGRLAIIDFLEKPLPVGPPPGHKLGRSFVIEEMGEAGWKLTLEPDILPYQYFLVFEPENG